MPLRRVLGIFIFRFIFPAPLNPQAASSAPAARWRDPNRKRKRKLVQPAGTEEISAGLSIFPNPSRLSSPQRPGAKMLPYSWAKQERRVGWSLNSCTAVWRAEWRETLDRARAGMQGAAGPRRADRNRPVGGAVSAIAPKAGILLLCGK